MRSTATEITAQGNTVTFSNFFHPEKKLVFAVNVAVEGITSVVRPN